MPHFAYETLKIENRPIAFGAILPAPRAEKLILWLKNTSYAGSIRNGSIVTFSATIYSNFIG